MGGCIIWGYKIDYWYYPNNQYCSIDMIYYIEPWAIDILGGLSNIFAHGSICSIPIYLYIQIDPRFINQWGRVATIIQVYSNFIRWDIL